MKLLGHTFFDLIDKLTSSLFLPLGGALISIFFGWVLSPQATDEVLGHRFRPAARMLMWTARVLAPLVVGVILVRGLRDW